MSYIPKERDDEERDDAVTIPMSDIQDPLLSGKSHPLGNGIQGIIEATRSKLFPSRIKTLGSAEIYNELNGLIEGEYVGNGFIGVWDGNTISVSRRGKKENGGIDLISVSVNHEDGKYSSLELTGDGAISKAYTVKYGGEGERDEYFDLNLPLDQILLALKSTQIRQY